MRLCMAVFINTFAAASLASGHGVVGKTLASYTGGSSRLSASGLPEGWTTWSPRAEIAPRFSVDDSRGLQGRGALRIYGDRNAGAHGAWRHRVDGITAGRSYHLTACYQASGVPDERRMVSARLDWLDEKGRRARPPDFALDVGKRDGWVRIEHVASAPENARSVMIELFFAWAAEGSVWWDGIELREEAAPTERVVRAMTVYHRPQNTKSPAESVEQFCRIVEDSAAQKPDIICLPEGISIVGTGKSYAEVSEAVPGPTTRRLGVLAQKVHAYIVAGIYERAGTLVYNTAVLIDRSGRLAGKYRKTHLPYEEVEGGITPGDSYPVFTTDFGKVGMLICWDIQFPEPARALGARGAELVLVPIWGGSEVLARARAQENCYFLITSSFDMKTFIVDPEAKILAEATKDRPVVVSDLNLDRKILQPWLGNMKTRTWKERRPDIRIEAPDER